MQLPLIQALLSACLLTGCSAGLILEDVSEFNAPRNCGEATKLFNTFSMQATAISWHGSKSDPANTLTVDLVFENDKKWPIALSNSGNGVLYAVEISLQGGKSAAYPPKRAVGVVISAEAKTLKEAPGRPLFNPRRQARQKSQSDTPAATTALTDKVLDVNYRMKPNERQQAKLVFEVPRDNYLLTIERKFDGKPVQGTPTDHVAVCRILSGDNPVGPQRKRGVSGIY